MKIGQQVTYIDVGGERQPATVKAISGIGPGRKRRKVLDLAVGGDAKRLRAGVRHEDDATKGEPRWTLAPAAAAPAEPPPVPVIGRATPPELLENTEPPAEEPEERGSRKRK